MPVPFFVTFVGPDAPTGFTATAVAIGLDPEPASVSLAWTPVATAPANFVRYEVWAWDDEEDIHLIDFTDPAVSQYVHHFPRSGKLTTYGVRQITRSGVDEVVGNWANDDITVTLRHISLISTVDPFTYRVPIEYWLTKRRVGLQTQEWHTPAGGGNYVELGGSIRGREQSLSAQFMDRQDESGVTAETLQDAFEALFDTIPPHPFGFRDPRGKKYFARFNGNFTANEGKGAVRYTTDFTIRRIAFSEGV